MAVITHSAFVLKKCALMTKRDHPLPFVFSFGWHVTKALGLAKAEDVSISLWSHNAI
jgi:hypothetical protein